MGAKMKFVNIKTSDNKTFDLEWESALMPVVLQSQTMRTILDKQGIQEDSENDDIIEIKEITGPIFIKILEWCEWYIDQIVDIHNSNDVEKQELNEWEKKYIEMPAKIMFSLV